MFYIRLTPSAPTSWIESGNPGMWLGGYNILLILKLCMLEHLVAETASQSKVCVCVCLLCMYMDLWLVFSILKPDWRLPERGNIKQAPAEAGRRRKTLLEFLIPPVRLEWRRKGKKEKTGCDDRALSLSHCMTLTARLMCCRGKEKECLLLLCSLYCVNP